MSANAGRSLRQQLELRQAALVRIGSDLDRQEALTASELDRLTGELQRVSAELKRARRDLTGAVEAVRRSKRAREPAVPWLAGDWSLTLMCVAGSLVFQATYLVTAGILHCGPHVTFGLIAVFATVVWGVATPSQ